MVTLSSQMLQLLAMLLGMPDRESLSTLKEMLPEHGWLQSAVDELDGIPLDHWQAEHTQLFINGHPKTPCAPFESIYRHGQMEGPACQELGRLYAEAGVSPSRDLPVDYLGTMLAFAAWLSDQGTAEAEMHLQTLEQKHFALWLPEFSMRLTKETKLQLYRGMGKRLHDWVSA
ncbi:MAG: molecular chaperone TorD family protein [Sedimenticola sp.]